MEEGRSESVSCRGETSEGVVTSANNPPLSNLPVGRAPSSGWPSAENMESTPIQYTQYNPLPNHPRFASRYAFLPPVPAFVERNYRGPVSAFAARIGSCAKSIHRMCAREISLFQGGLPVSSISRPSLSSSFSSRRKKRGGSRRMALLGLILTEAGSRGDNPIEVQGRMFGCIA